MTVLELNPGSKDWDNQINDYLRNNVERIDIDEFASIYAEEEAKEKPAMKDLVEGLKAIDPANEKLELGMMVRFLTHSLTHSLTLSYTLSVKIVISLLRAKT